MADYSPEALKKILATGHGGDLPPVHQMLFDAITSLQDVDRQPELFAELEALANGNLTGKTARSLKKILSSEFSGNNSVEEKNYEVFVRDTQQAYIHILSTYKGYLDPENDISQLTASSQGYYYQGPAAGKYDLFIALADRLAQIDARYIHELLDIVENNDPYYDYQDALINWLQDEVFAKLPAAKKTDPTNDELRNLKSLKKNIDQLAEWMGAPSRIINSRKFTKDLSTVAVAEEKEVAVDPQADSQLKAVAVPPYLVVDRGDSRVKFIPSADKKSQRAGKKVARVVAKVSAYTIATSEGAIAGKSFFMVLGATITGGAVVTLSVFSLPVLVAMFGAAVVVGVSGWYCNKYLFNGDLYDTLKDIFVPKTIADPDREGETKAESRLFLDQNGKPINKWLKFGATVLGTLSVATGFVYGCLTFNTVFGLVGSAVATLAAPWLVAGIAGVAAIVFATTTFLGITALLWMGISDAVKNSSKIVDFFKENFVGQTPAKMLLGVVKTVAVVATVAVVTVFTLALMTDESRKFLGWAGNTDHEKLGSIARSVTFVLAAIDSFVHLGFGFKNLFGPVDAALAPAPQKMVVREPNSLQLAAKRDFRNDMKKSMVAAVLNGLGQAALVMAAVPIAAAIFGLPFLALPALVIAAGVTKFAYSALPNIYAFYRVKMSGKVDLEPAPSSDEPLQNGIGNAGITAGLTTGKGAGLQPKKIVRFADKVTYYPGQDEGAVPSAHLGSPTRFSFADNVAQDVAPAQGYSPTSTAKTAS